jgi:DNA-directed RNA polymerase subunit A"
MSALGSTQIIVLKPDNTVYRGPISKLIDPLCSTQNDLVSEVVDIKGYKILGVDQNNEKTKWNEISQISRHPANGRLVKVTTKSGKTTTATLSHSFLKRKEDGIIPTLGSELKIGDRIPVAKFTPEVENPLHTFDDFKLTKDFGWFIGAYLADGHITGNTICVSKIIPEYSNKIIDFAKSIGKEAFYKFTPKSEKSFGPNGNTHFSHSKLAKFLIDNFSKLSDRKHVAPFVFQSNKDFISGIISGYFDGDGNVNSMIGKQMIRSSSVSEQLTIDMIILLSYFGIFASKCVEKVKNHTIQISKKYAKIFKQEIGFTVVHKSNSLNEIIKYLDREDVHSVQEMIDKIPEIGHIIAKVGKALELPVRIYGRYNKKESIGRSTLIKYIEEFSIYRIPDEIKNDIAILKQAAYGDVIWDEIVSLEILDDPKEYVYDFTVPGNESFMVDCNILVHNTLNTFHYAGVSAKNVTLGVPRLKELINVTRKLKTPSLTMYENGSIKNYGTVGQKRVMENIRSSLEFKTLQNIIKCSDIVYDDDPEFIKDKPIIDMYKNLYSATDNPIPERFLSLRLQFNSKDLEYVDISMLELTSLVEKSIGNENKIICSDDNTCAENGCENLFIRIIPDDDGNSMLSILRKIEIFCMNIKIKGCENVEKVYIKESKINEYSSEKGHHKENQWILETEGSNLLDTLSLNNLDHYKTISNNVIEIFEIFGIEAARQSLLNELKMVLSFDGSYVNYRHLTVLVDTMTCRGSLTSVTRHGINRIDSGALTKSSFEETVEVLTEAAAFGELDALKGISDNIMLGQLVPCGTGVMDVYYDVDMRPDEKVITHESTPVISQYIPSKPDYDPIS